MNARDARMSYCPVQSSASLPYNSSACGALAITRFCRVYAPSVAGGTAAKHAHGWRVRTWRSPPFKASPCRRNACLASLGELFLQEYFLQTLRMKGMHLREAIFAAMLPFGVFAQYDMETTLYLATKTQCITPGDVMYVTVEKAPMRQFGFDDDAEVAHAARSLFARNMCYFC